MLAINVCPYCDFDNNTGYEICPQCNKSLLLVKCPQCGFIENRGMVKCSNCDYIFDEDIDQPLCKYPKLEFPSKGMASDGIFSSYDSTHNTIKGTLDEYYTRRGLSRDNEKIFPKGNKIPEWGKNTALNWGFISILIGIGIIFFLFISLDFVINNF